MIFREDLGTGYMYCYAPEHPCANKAGKVMEHVYVMYQTIGRKLRSNECVHHKDRNRKNNKVSNLQLMTQEEHRSLHSLEDHGVYYLNTACPVCGDVFLSSTTSSRRFCTSSCAAYNSRVFEVTKEELAELVWMMPTTKVAKLFNVSDVAVAKRCRVLGVSKPPRGYWAKIYATS